ncbi:DHH family phosphoesterase [Telmatocola sphagniphila]|uniref:DHH family phosphoesterase n=1 Tax=Telmatocola sphagniphila TaxID=1123043 RepID=A0A8E6EV50_9BACT|nr:DHH family phosphoesterase [Telmatocola sphagniphila]QVL32260.1 DHH family phosphoesterase [Telmatocola sphagniphila]
MARRSADAALLNGKVHLNGKSTPGVRRSDRFLTSLAKAKQVTFISHVHPDPDSLGSMLGLAHLVERKLQLPTRITRDGIVSRAENKAMVELLNLELLPVEKIHWKAGDAVVMVDSQPNTGRHSIGKDAPLKAVIDHHETGGDLKGIPFHDIRPHIGATCTLVTKYLLEQEIDVPDRVATALLYGIETEVCGFPREATPCDDGALQFLYPLAEKNLLAQIRNARLPHSHFECLLQALQSSFIYDRLIISWVNDLPQPEQAAEVVDFMVRFEKVDWAVCGGVWENKLILSVRTSLHGAQAGEMLQRVVGRMGKAGGHDRRAGGCIRLRNDSENALDEVQARLRKRFLKELDIDEQRGQRLVPLRAMLENLQA